MIRTARACVVLLVLLASCERKTPLESTDQVSAALPECPSSVELLPRNMVFQGSGPYWEDIADAMLRDDLEVVVDDIQRPTATAPAYAGLPTTEISGHFTWKGLVSNKAFLGMTGYDTTSMRVQVGDVLLVRKDVGVLGGPDMELGRNSVLTVRTSDRRLAMAMADVITEGKGVTWPSPLLPELEAVSLAASCNWSNGYHHAIAPLSLRNGTSSAEVLQGSSAMVGDLEVGVAQSIREERVGAGLAGYGTACAFSVLVVDRTFLGLARDP